jgi:ankyrin repeat protein
VKECLKSRLAEEAMNISGSDEYRADAAYEYAVLVLNSEEVSTSSLPKALELLAMSAKYGHIEALYSVGKLTDAFSYPLPFSRKQEIEWLTVASESGSATGKRRFQELEPERFTQVAREIRNRYGFNCPKMNKTLFEESQHAKKSTNFLETLFAHFYEVAITGNVQLLLKLPGYRKEVYNCQNILGETPLLVACRGGHVTVTKLLLKRGADATIATKDGVTPLHFLSAFDDEHIEEMASLLLHHGAEIDKVCSRALIYKELPDSPFGLVQGTPLLWAVAARNSCAVQTLVERGADPFTTGNPSEALEEGYVEISAIIWAAMFHEHDLLKILLSPRRKSEINGQRVRALLNPTSGRHPGPLYAAIDCNPGFRFREYLIHGNQFEEAAFRCVQHLIQCGSDPVLLTRDRNGSLLGDDPIMLACIGGNMSIIKYLWEYQNGTLRPSPKIWLSTLVYVIFHRIIAVFDFLIEHRSDIATNSKIDIQAVNKSFTLTNDQHIVRGVLKLVLRPNVAYLPSQYKELFMSAIIAGQFDAARLVFQSGCFDAVSRIGDETFLGVFIAASPHYPNMEQKVSFILSLPAEKDELFWNVSYRGGTGVTALQAVICSSTPQALMNATVLNAIIKHFHEPTHLNAQMRGNPSTEFAGFSALHLAAKYSEYEAVTQLLAQPGIKANLLNDCGLTPTDICICLEQAFGGRQQLYEYQENKPSFNRKRQANMKILYKLLAEGGRIAKFSTVFIRSSEDDYIVLDRIKGYMPGIRLLGTSLREGSSHVIIRPRDNGVQKCLKTTYYYPNPLALS